MKAHKLILAALAALFVMQACDEPEIDRAAITNVDVNNIVLVEQQVNAYCLSWAAPEITTNHGKAYANSYDIYAAQKADTVFKKIKTVSGTWAIVTYDELTGLFKENESFDASDINSIVFGVCVTGLQTSMCYSDYDFYLDTDNELNYNYQGVNRWFVCGEESKEGRKQGNVAVVDVKIEDKNANPWAVQFCNVFHNLKKQVEGAKFTLRFEVLWDSETSDAASYAILNGTDPKVDGDKLLHDDYQWSEEENTELLFEGGYWKGQNQTHIAHKGIWTPVEWGGVVGEKGVEYIGVQLNLARPNEKYEVNNGTFYFRNITVEIEGDIVASYFMDRESGDAQVSAQADGNGVVVGGGYYAYGETALLTAVAQPGSVFAGWSDGSTENPRKLFVDGDVEFVAKFLGGIYMTPLQSDYRDFYFNKWFTDGDKSIPLKIEANVAGEYSTAFAIEVLEEGDPWNNEFCCILRGNDGQAENNKFTFDCDVYWESTSGIDSADIFLLTGKSYIYGNDNDDSNDLSLHDDWQWSADHNTELINDNENGFWRYVHNQPRKIPNKEWTHVSWGDELVIGEKGKDYIGIQINLTNTAGTNNGTFYFRNIKISTGNTIYDIDYSDH